MAQRFKSMTEDDLRIIQCLFKQCFRKTIVRCISGPMRVLLGVCGHRLHGGSVLQSEENSQILLRAAACGLCPHRYARRPQDITVT